MVLLLAACKPHKGETTREEGDAEAIAREDKQLQALADRIDPGPQAPMFEVMPTWLKSKVDDLLADAPTGRKAVSEAREAIAAWDKQEKSDASALLRAALQLGRGVVLAERAVAAGSDDPELLAVLTKAYRLLQQFQFFEKNQLFASALTLASELATKDGGVEGKQIEEALAALRVALSRAEALHLHTAARLLREHPRHPTIPEVLIRLSQAESAADRYPQAIELRRLANVHKGAQAMGPDHVAVADLCYRALDVKCGDEERATAALRGPEPPADDKKREAFAKQLAGTDALAAGARRAQALADAPGLAEQVERGHVLLGLGRRGDAEAVFSALKEKYPNDARPVTGLAVAALNREADFTRAATLVRGARGLEGRDKLFYEVALGTVPLAVMSEMIQEFARGDGKTLPSGFDALADELMELVHGFAAFDPARAAVIELALETGRVAAPKFMSGEKDGALAILRAAPAKVFALVQKYPESKDAWKLLYAASRLTSDAAEAKRMATAALPPALQADPDVRLQQARALIDLAVMFEDVSLMEAAAAAAASLPAGGDANAVAWVTATIEVLRGQAGDADAFKRGFDAFAALIEKTSGVDRALAINNAGYVQAFAGVAEAVQTFQAAAAIDEGAKVAAVNLAALAFQAEQRDGLAAKFADAADSKIAAVRLLARAWLVALADAGYGDVKVTRKEFAAALKSERALEFRGATPVGRFGIAASGDFKLSFGFSTTTGLVLVDEVVTRWWFVAAPPGLDALLAGDAKPKPPPKSAKAK